MLTLPKGILEDREAMLRRDIYQGIPGAISVDPDFVMGLERIDPRLVLRWDPRVWVWQVWLRITDGWLWCMPTWECRNPETGMPWKPCGWDLDKIRKLKWEAEHRSWKEREEETLRQEREVEAAERYQRELLRRESGMRIAKLGDMTHLKLGHTRGTAGGDPVRGGKKR